MRDFKIPGLVIGGFFENPPGQNTRRRVFWLNRWLACGIRYVRSDSVDLGPHNLARTQDLQPPGFAATRWQKTRASAETSRQRPSAARRAPHAHICSGAPAFWCAPEKSDHRRGHRLVFRCCRGLWHGGVAQPANGARHCLVRADATQWWISAWFLERIDTKQQKGKKAAKSCCLLCPDGAYCHRRPLRPAGPDREPGRRACAQMRMHQRP